MPTTGVSGGFTAQSIAAGCLLYIVGARARAFKYYKRTGETCEKQTMTCAEIAIGCFFFFSFSRVVRLIVLAFESARFDVT